MVDAEGFANLTTEALARLTRSSLRTVRRWRASGLMPRWAFDLLTLLLYRPLGMLADDWDGWHLHTSKIEAPNGYQFTPGELMTIPLRLQEIAALRSELALLKHDNARHITATHDIRRGVPLQLDFAPIGSQPAPPGTNPPELQPENSLRARATREAKVLPERESTVNEAWEVPAHGKRAMIDAHRGLTDSIDSRC